MALFGRSSQPQIPEFKEGQCFEDTKLAIELRVTEVFDGGSCARCVEQCECSPFRAPSEVYIWRADLLAGRRRFRFLAA